MGLNINSLTIFWQFVAYPYYHKYLNYIYQYIYLYIYILIYMEIYLYIYITAAVTVLPRVTRRAGFQFRSAQRGDGTWGRGPRWPLPSPRKERESGRTLQRKTIQQVNGQRKF